MAEIDNIKDMVNQAAKHVSPAVMKALRDTEEGPV